MNCPRCGGELVEVDNPFRREVRHRRGQECAPPPADPSPAPAPPGDDDSGRAVLGVTRFLPFDQDRWLGDPPWKSDDPALVAWEAAHGHDVRLKCYVEFGCQAIESALEAAEAARDAAVAEAARLRAERDNARGEARAQKANLDAADADNARLRAALGRVEALVVEAERHRPFLGNKVRTGVGLVSSADLRSALSDVGEGCDR